MAKKNGKALVPAKKSPGFVPAKKGENPFATKLKSAIEKREEKLHKDLDHDGEKGESAAHRAKVLGYSKEEQLKRSKGPKPAKKG